MCAVIVVLQGPVPDCKFASLACIRTAGVFLSPICMFAISQYLKLDTTAQSAFTIFVNPLATVVLNMVRVCARVCVGLSDNVDPSSERCWLLSPDPHFALLSSCRCRLGARACTRC